MTQKRLRIVMIGQKGVPARYGGVETHVEQVSLRLAARGHDVSVFCRSRFRPSAEDLKTIDGLDVTDDGVRYNGIRLLFRPSINTKHLDAATHTLFCALEVAFRQSYDIIHFHGIGPSAFIPIPRSAGQTVVTTVHALDWRQSKWGRWAKRRLQFGEATAVRKSSGVSAVSRILVDYIAERYGVEATYIPNGTHVSEPRPPRSIGEYGLGGNDYILTVGRIIPDRGLHYLVEAFKRVEQPIKLVIVGSETPRSAYSDHLEKMADDRVIFTGDLYGEALAELYSNCRVYVLASEVEGLPISVCEAMGFAKPVLLSDIPENREVGGDAASYFKVNDVNGLRLQLNKILENGDALDAGGQAGLERVRELYNWDDVAARTEAFYRETLGQNRSA